MEKLLLSLVQSTSNRIALWTEFINTQEIRSALELGVFRGKFAEQILKDCPEISQYYMLDPWRHLDEWNKPANKSNDIFDAYYEEVLEKTVFAKDRRIILRGKTTEVIQEIEDNSLDFAYIDGDHTLKGISIDLINVWPKIKEGGFIAGDDFTSTIWQHRQKYEPTMVFPFAVYFAEAMQSTIYALPASQFLLKKGGNTFRFVDLTEGDYQSTSIRDQLFKFNKFSQILRKLKPRKS